MKKLILFICMLGMFGITYSQEIASATSGSLAKITFTENSFDFGTIKQGKPASHKFTFTNTGDAPLVINNVTTSCGCTASDYPKEAIKPGGTAEIVITYNASNKGAFNKTATVFSNTGGDNIVLKIKGIVE